MEHFRGEMKAYCTTFALYYYIASGSVMNEAYDSRYPHSN